MSRAATLLRLFALSLAAFATAGCGSADPCAAAQGTCLTLDVTGDVGPLDAIAVTLSGAVTFQMSAPLTGLPVHIGIQLPDVSGPVHALGVGKRGGADVARGDLDVQVTALTHTRGNLVLGAGGVDLGMSSDSNSLQDLRATSDLAPPDLAAADLTTLPDLAPPPPILTALSPPLGPSTGGTMLTLTGTGFVNGATVTVASKAAAIVLFSATQIVVTAPASPGSQGRVPVVVTNPDKRTATRGDLFSYYTTMLAFTPQFMLSTGVSPVGVAVADLDNDKHLDLVVANAADNTVSVLQGDGKGNFASRVNFPTAMGPGGPATADLNGDGSVDVVVANHNSNSVGVFEGLGNGSLKARVDFAAFAGPVGVALGDVDGDQKLDIVVGGDVASKMGTLKGLGNLAFGGIVSYTTGTAAWIPAVGDVNGDGKLDVVVPQFTAYSAGVFLNNGMGAFPARTDYAVLGNGIGVALGDFDANGSLDLAVANFSNMITKISIFKNQGNGTFANRVEYDAGHDPYGVAVFDLNGDGRLDLVVPDSGDKTGSILLGKDDATFAPRVIVPVGTHPRSVASGDFDEDGKPDLVFANDQSNNLSVCLNRSM